MSKFKLPQGMQDYLPDTLYHKLNIEDKLIKTFEKYAYKG